MSKDNRSPLERLVRLGWDALDATRRNDRSALEQMTQNARSAMETVRRGILEEQTLKQFQFRLPLDNAVAANVELELSVGESTVQAIEGTPNTLLDADLAYLGSISFGVSGDVERSAFLRQSTPLTVGWANPVHWTTRPRWQIGLAGGLPTDLRVQAGVGDANLNLAGLQLRSLRVEGNIGRTNITLPAQAGTLQTTLRGGAGGIALNVPRGVDGTVRVQGGVGGFALNLEAGAAVRMQVQGGIGKTLLTPGFRRTEAIAPGLPTTGTWQTPDFDLAQHQLTVEVADTVLGNLSVRVMTV